MVMADFGSRDRGKRGRGRGFRRRGSERGRGYYYYEREEDDEDYPPASNFRGPVILAKNDHNSTNDYVKNHARADSSSHGEKPVVMLRSHEDAGKHSNSQSSIFSSLANDAMPAHVYKDKKQTPRPLVIEGSVQNRLAPPPEMTRSLKLIDDNMNWCESPVNMLLDQTDFLSVGVLGLQGVGKSTIMSVLAGNYAQDPEKSFMFRPQCSEVREVCAHQTTGVDMFVTGERVVCLDTQPMLSASVLDYMIHNDKKYSADYSTAENSIEMQSLQIASLMMTVSNVVVVVLDWFADLELLRLIETAEMLKPATPSSGQDNHHDVSTDYYPHIVFVLNCARREDWSLEKYNAMQATLGRILRHSKLKYTGGLNMVNAGLMPRKRGQVSEKDVNLFLLPSFDEEDDTVPQKQSTKDGVNGLMVGYRGHPSFSQCASKLRNTLFAMPRQLLTHTTLSEKNWFHYAARSWESIKKSVLFSEYNRLLP